MPPSPHLQVESLLRHTVASTVTAPGQQHDMFALLLEQCGHLLCMDAFLGDLTMNCLRQIKGMRIGTIVNEYRPEQRTFRMTNNVKSWMDAIVADLKEGKRLVVPCMSTERAFQLVTRLLEDNPEYVDQNAILLHTSLQPDSVKKQMVDVEKLWGAPEIRIVIYSPTIESGIDFSVPGHFDKMYVYICRYSCLPLGLIQMTGRVRALSDPKIECLVAPSIRLGSNCRYGNTDRITASDALSWLEWAYRDHDMGVKAEVGECPRDVEYTSDGASMSLRMSPHLHCISAALADRHNADTCFVSVFQDMIESAGHRMELSSTLLSSRLAYTESQETASISFKAKMLHEMYVTEDPDEITAIRDRIRTNNATEDDKWNDFKLSYLEAWGLGDVDEAFVKKHGHTLSGPQKTLLLLRVLRPALTNVMALKYGELEMTERIDELKVKCIRELINGLGLRHALDDETSCGDYWTEPFTESRLYKMCSVFHDFTRAMPLFRDDHKPPKEWTRQTVTHVVDSVLNAIGLKIKGNAHRKRFGTTFTRDYVYKLDEDHVADMREFLALKLKTMPAEWDDGNGRLQLYPPSLHTRIRDLAIERHAHLLCRRPEPDPPSKSECADDSQMMNTD